MAAKKAAPPVKKAAAKKAVKKAVRKRRTVKPVASDLEQITDTLLQLVSARYPDDRVKPGLVMSFLGNARLDKAQRYYVSIVRYPHGEETKSILHKSYGATFREALLSAANHAAGNAQQVEALQASLRGSL